MYRWLEERKETSRRAAKPKKCRRCGADVLEGLDDDVAAMTAVVDPEPLAGPREEAVARFDDRDTFDLIPSKGGFDLWRRSPRWHTSWRWTVLQEHKCR